MKMGLEMEREMAMKSEDCVCHPAQCINITKTGCKGKERERESEVERSRMRGARSRRCRRLINLI